MGEIRVPEQVKLIAGIIVSSVLSKDVDLLKSIEEELSALYGAIDSRSELIKFDNTDYYRDEMGDDLMRYWVSFDKLCSPENISRVKTGTNELEQKFSLRNKRPINIDPGYITGAKLVLFSTKDYSHRIYIGNGINAEVTLIYKKGDFS